MPKGKKRERKRVPKEARKNLRLWAEGVRETILAPHVDGYTAALNQGWSQERKFLKSVCKEYHGRISWRVPDCEEPELAEWSPTAVQEREELSDVERAEKRGRVKSLNARIRRWFTYRIRRIQKHRMSAGLDPAKDPYAVLLAKLSGLASPPKARQGFQQYMRESYQDKIAPVVAERWAKEREENGTAAERTKEPKAGFRAMIAREVFAALPHAEQKALSDRAKSEAQEAKATYTASLNAPPSDTPEARQRCISSVANFVGPILQGITAHTGMHATLIIGGPVPSSNGELGTLHYSYGRNKTALAQHWGQWDKPRFTRNVQNFMMEYLETAFTPEDRLKAALPASGTVDLTAAKYTINNTADDSGSDSDSDSDESTDSDSGTDSDEEERARTRKKRKLEGLAEASAGKKGPIKKPRARKPADIVSVPPPTPASPAPSSSTPASPAPSSSTPAFPAPASSMPPPPAAPDPLDFDADLSGEDDEEEAPSAKKLAWWDISPEERNANIQRNKAAQEELKRAWHTLMPESAPPVRQERQPRRKKDTPAAPTRRSVRQAKAAPSSAVAAGEGASGTEHEMGDSAGTSSAAAMDVDSPAGAPPTPDLSPASRSSDSAGAAMEVDATPDATPASTSTPSLAPPFTDPAPLPAVPPLSRVVQTHVTVAAAAGRGTTTAPAAALAPCPDDAAPWFVHARTEMTRIEYASCFQNGPTNLSPKGRPKQVGAWIANGRLVNGRKRQADVAVPDPTAYALVWQEWWDKLQPAWRKRAKDGRWSVEGRYDGQDWGPLYHWGVNGVLNLVASLCFWGRCVLANQSESDCRAWEVAVDDVTWMMEGMAVYYERFNRKF
ncbi:hypothetical protein DFH06DRAFT_1317333 [Mycena polygramma]|nr:hypothetical protein DFH06DRAFT_1317333 [Mycena polygramma]